MFKKIAIWTAAILVVLVVGFVIVVSLQPSEFTVERTATMAAPASEVFAQVNDLKAWDSWTAWKDLDPNPTTKLSDPSSGKGATYYWSGNDQIGEGTLTILESKPDELVVLEQEFVRPMAGKARMTCTLTPAEGGTRVVWKMDGHNDFLGKAVCLFMDMDAMLGTAFEQGLSNMKEIVEKPDQAPGSTASPEGSPAEPGKS